MNICCTHQIFSHSQNILNLLYEHLILLRLYIGCTPNSTSILHELLKYTQSFQLYNVYHMLNPLTQANTLFSLNIYSILYKIFLTTSTNITSTQNVLDICLLFSISLESVSKAIKTHNTIHYNVVCAWSILARLKYRYRIAYANIKLSTLTPTSNHLSNFKCAKKNAHKNNYTHHKKFLTILHACSQLKSYKNSSALITFIFLNKFCMKYCFIYNSYCNIRSIYTPYTKVEKHLIKIKKQFTLTVRTNITLTNTIGTITSSRKSSRMF